MFECFCRNEMCELFNMLIERLSFDWCDVFRFFLKIIEDKSF